MSRRTTAIPFGLCTALAMAALGQPPSGPPATVPTAAQPGAAAYTPSPPDNAALLYYRYWEMGGKDFFDMLRDRFNAGQDWAPDAATHQVVVDHSGPVAGILRATALARCDFGMEFELGFGALVPHYGLLRSTARWLAADGRLRLEAGDRDGAAERLAAIYRVAEHSGQDGVLIGTFVGIAIAGLAESETRWYINHGHLTDKGKEAVMVAAGKVRGTDPFGAKRSIANERWLADVWMRQHLLAAPRTERAKELGGLLSDDPKVARQVEALSDEMLQQEFDSLRAYYEALAAAWDKPNADRLLANLNDAAKPEPGRIFVSLLAPSWGKAHASVVKAGNELQATLTSLAEYKPVSHDIPVAPPPRR